jgi:hypothetical protein
VNGEAVAKQESIFGNPYVQKVTTSSGREMYAGAGLDPAKILFKSPEEAEAAAKGARAFYDPQVQSGILKWYDQATAWLKKGATKFFPSFHMRNRFSNRIQSSLEDVPVLGGHYRNAGTVLAGGEVGVKSGNTGKVLNAHDLLSMAEEHGILSRGQIANIHSGLGLDDPKHKGLQKAIEKVLEGVATLPATGASALAGGNPGLLKKALTGGGGTLLEAQDRLGHFIYKLERGFTPEAAAESVNKALFNYAREAQTPFENAVMQRTMFFYTYQRNIIPFMFQKTLQETGKVAPWLHALAQGGEQEWLPGWTKRQSNVSLGQDPGGRERVLTGIDTPMEAALKPLQGFQEGIGAGLAQLGAGFNPLVKAPIELMTGQNLFYNKPIREMNRVPPGIASTMSPEQRASLGIRDVLNEDGTVKYSLGDPYALWAMNQLPTTRAMGTADKLLNPDRTFWENALLNLTGARIQHLDPEEEIARREREAALARMQELADEGRAAQVQNAYRVLDPNDAEAQAAMRALRSPKKTPGEDLLAALGVR